MNRGLIPGLVFALAGCATSSTFQTAQLGEPGEARFTYAIANGDVEVGGRYTVSRQVELGVRAWPVGAAIDSKFQLVRGLNFGRVDVAIDPAVGMSVSSGYWWQAFGEPGPASRLDQVDAYLPIIFGFNLRPEQQLVITAKAIVHALAFGQNGVQVLGGISVGYAFGLGSKFVIIPEVSALNPSRIGDQTSWNVELGCGFQYRPDHGTSGGVLSPVTP